MLGSGRNSSPACTGALFSVFQAVRNTAVSGIAFEGALGDDLFNLLAYFGLCWGTRRLHFGHHWAFISRTDFEEILGAKMMDFGDSLRTREMLPAVAAGLARGTNSYFVLPWVMNHDFWYHASEIMIFGLLIC